MTIDYRALLAKYMRHVARQEGVTFVEQAADMSVAEFEALQAIEREELPASPPPSPYVTVTMPASEELLEMLAECTRKHAPISMGINDHAPGSVRVMSYSLTMRESLERSTVTIQLWKDPALAHLIQLTGIP